MWPTCLSQYFCQFLTYVMSNLLCWVSHSALVRQVLAACFFLDLVLRLLAGFFS